MKKQMDWQEIASKYYEKSMTLAILFMLFTFMVTPEVQVKPYEREEVEVTEVEEIPPEIKEKIKPPTQTKKPVIDIVIEEDLEGGEDDDLEVIDTIESTSFDPFEEAAPPPKDELPSKFTVYEDPPVPIQQVSPEYPEFAKKSGIEGQVVVEVAVMKDGSVGAVNVVKSLMAGPGGLDEAAKEAVKQWKFQPAQSGGKPVACWVTFPISFSLD